ncbi:transposase, partial [Paraliomyxa miuraensis]|uniref:transposase n=1 Tax=Paraliomyxa miuraensis TaxID=376150 RepID=UPI00389AABE4
MPRCVGTGAQVRPERVPRSRRNSQWGLEHRDLTGIRAIGVDEVLWHRGHKYLTVVYQIDAHCRRLLWMGQDRTKECIDGFFDWFGLRARWLRFICSDQH